MPETPRTASSVIKYRKTAYIAAATGTGVAIVVCALLGMGRTEYQSQAVLSYAVDAPAKSQGSMLSAETVAGQAMDDAHLNTILDGFGLYPELRQGSAQTTALSTLRSHIAMKQAYVSRKSQVELQLSFRDAEPLKVAGVTNALANVLATYVAPVAGSVPPAATTESEEPVPAAESIPTQTSASPIAAPTVASPPTAAPVVVGNLAGLTKDQLHRKMNWIDGQLADLATEESTLHSASLTVQGRISQVQASGHEEPSAPREPARPAIDASAATRTQLNQQLAAAQQKLTALRERYTEAYPDVQTTQADIAHLEARLAELPPPARQPAAARRAPELYQNNVDELTAEESKLGGKLRDVEHQISGLEHRREQVRAAMLTAPDTVSATQPVPPPIQKPTPPAPVRVQPKSRSASGNHPAANGSNAASSATTTDAVPVRPFHIVSTASASVPVQRLSPTVFGTVAAVWVVFLMLCFVPLRVMKSAVIASESDVRATVPRQVAYLGSVRRIAH